MLFWNPPTRTVFCPSSDPWPGAEELRFRLVQARLRHVFGLCTGALFFFLGGSKGAVLDPNVLFFAERTVFSLSRPGCAMPPELG